MTHPLLTIGYSTLASRVGSIELPPAQPDVEILVVVQGTHAESITRFDDRHDVEVIAEHGVGVARSRNVVLGRATGRYLVFGDDDATWRMAGVRAVVDWMEASPGTSLVLAMACDEHGEPRKRYRSSEGRLHRWNSAKAGTIELVVRRSEIVAAGVAFDENFGAGAANFLGDEYIFVTDVLRAGLHGRFRPVVISEHPAESSGSGFGTVADARARSAVFDRVFGWRASLARLAFLARRPGRFGSWRLGLGFVIGRVPSVEPTDPDRAATS
ncbi:glycosyltransferase [Ilumatobacter sp.]|uniref:glycosyltransferase n=1 Tax=Ilumatobacter sp. TaxID=1967498 RepID=UPI003C49AA07